MFPLSISRSALLAVARVAGIAAVLSTPAASALAAPERPTEERVPLCTTAEAVAKPEPRASRRHADILCPALTKWLDWQGAEAVESATTVRIPVEDMKADRQFWLSIPASIRTRLNSFDWIEVARIPLTPGPVEGLGNPPAAAHNRTSLHPSSRPAASQR